MSKLFLKLGCARKKGRVVKEYIQQKKIVLPLILALIFMVSLVSISVYFYIQSNKQNDKQIAEHIATLDDIFRRINAACKITGFRDKRNNVNFLNVIKFEGAQIGPMNLVNPSNWQGPYLENNLASQGKEYQIIANKHGYYLIPGDGVKLSNGKIIGSSLVIDENSDIQAMMRNTDALLSGGKPLAAYIETEQKFDDEPEENTDEAK